MMTPTVTNRNWITLETPLRPLVLFRNTFAAIWLLYDLIDLVTGQTQNWSLVTQGFPVTGLRISLCVLIACEAGLLLGWRPRTMAFCAFLARGFEAWIFGLNDFYYFSVAALILTQFDYEKPRAWPRDVLILQTAWIYFASALLKASQPFLSGGYYFVRQNYVAAVLPLPFPDFYRSFISTLQGNSVLAYATVVSEMSLALTLIAWWAWPDRRVRLRIVAIALAVGIHGFAACTADVFFFGASLVAQIALLTYEPSMH